jgi:hypothetical protein
MKQFYPIPATNFLIIKKRIKKTKGKKNPTIMMHVFQWKIKWKYIWIKY